MSKGSGRGASIISGPNSHLYGEPFYCVACDRPRTGRLAVRVRGGRLCWPCARAVYRRLAREVAQGTDLADSLERVGRPRRPPPPPPDADHEDLQLREGRARAELDQDRTDLLQAALPLVMEAVASRRRSR